MTRKRKRCESRTQLSELPPALRVGGVHCLKCKVSNYHALCCVLRLFLRLEKRLTCSFIFASIVFVKYQIANIERQAKMANRTLPGIMATSCLEMING